jgi:hypothetical protein
MTQVTTTYDEALLVYLQPSPSPLDEPPVGRGQQGAFWTARERQLLCLSLTSALLRHLLGPLHCVCLAEWHAAGGSDGLVHDARTLLP